jgi:hypothetical protein
MMMFVNLCVILEYASSSSEVGVVGPSFMAGGPQFQLTVLNNDEMACDSFISPYYNLTGQIVIIQRKGQVGNKCDIGIKARHIQDARAAGVLIYNISNDTTAITVNSSSSNGIQPFRLDIPVAKLNYQDGSALIDLYRNANSTCPLMIQFTARMVRIKS